MSALAPVDEVVRSRYSTAAQQRVEQLCCPVNYDARYLAVIPQEVLDRDYGCGDPSKYVQPGDTVLDLGSGGGKICFIAAQVVGPMGRVIGVDMNEEMLSLAEQAKPQVAEKLGYSNVEFRKGRIQDLALDLAAWEKTLATEPVRDAAGWQRAEQTAHRLRKSSPLVADNSVDVVVSNCVLNLVHDHDRRALFAEIFRVLKPGGRAVISDIVAGRDVPVELQNDPELWSGCISGAFREDLFPAAFVDAGFIGIEILARQAEPWTVVGGIEFRSLTVRAWKPVEVVSEAKVTVIYNGPWASVMDEHGEMLDRGLPTEMSAEVVTRWQSVPALRSSLNVITSTSPLAIISESCCTPNSGSSCC